MGLTLVQEGWGSSEQIGEEGLGISMWMLGVGD